MSVDPSAVTAPSPGGGGSSDGEKPSEAIGKYRIVERIGRGAMGVVYAAIDEHLDRRVAVKLMLSDFDEEPEPPVWPEEPGALTKMMHFEINVEDMDAAVAYAVVVGARSAPHQPPDRDPDLLRVMLDPAGHPFCLYL